MPAFSAVAPARAAGRIAATYLALALLWIYFSDRFLAAVMTDPGHLTLWQTGKGWLFVAASAALIFFLVHRALAASFESQQALHESSRRFRQLFQNSFSAIVISEAVADPRGEPVDFVVHHANQAVEKHLGRPAEQLVGRRWSEIDHEGAQALFRNVSQILLTGESSVCDSTISSRGQTFHVSAYRIEGKRVALVFEDITARKRIEEGLRRSTEELTALNSLGRKVNTTLSLVQTSAAALQGIMDAVHPDLTFLFLREGDRLVFQAMQPAVSQARLGQISDHRVGQCLCGLAVAERTALYSRDIHQDRRCSLQECKKAGIRSFAALPLRSGDDIIGIVGLASDRERDFAVQAEFLETLAGQVAVALVNARLYDDIRKNADQLEARVRERTAQLEAANAELEAFSYSVSHDLRAPLRAISGYTRILLEDHAPQLGAEGERICAVICENTCRMAELIDDLLAFSRLGRAALAPTPIDMEALAKTVFNELTTSRERERIDLVFKPLPRAVGDPTMVRQIWNNLLENAIKFSSKKERAKIEITAEEIDEETVFTVSDNGAGFDMAYMGKLFGVFQRLHSSRDFEGTGVGLAIVQRIVQRHGGRIWAEGAPGEGATFSFTLAGRGA